MNYPIQSRGFSRNVRLCLGLAVASIATCAMLPTSALAANSNIVRNYSTGLCIAINSTTSGSSLIQKNCDKSDSTLWQEEVVDKDGYGTSGNAYVRFRNVQTGLCLDLQSNMSTDGLPIVQHACSSSNTQQWYGGVANNTLGFFALHNRSTGKCIDAGGTTVVQQWTCNSSANNQMWYY
jgi:hypothetical protein